MHHDSVGDKLTIVYLPLFAMALTFLLYFTVSTPLFPVVSLISSFPFAHYLQGQGTQMAFSRQADVGTGY